MELIVALTISLAYPSYPMLCCPFLLVSL